MTFDLETLKLAFTRKLLDTLASADRHLDAEEAALVESLAPAERLRAAGLFDAEDRRTPRFDEAAAEADLALATALSLEERLALVTSFLELCVVDGELHRDEGSLLYAAATMLGIDGGTFDRHLDTLTEHVGAVELDAPEE